MAAAAWFALLCAASVTMTLGNKLLMVGALNQHKDLLVLLQNAIGALTLAALAWYHSLDVGLPLDRRLTLLFITDALVRYVQLYTSFAALQHLPVAATTVVRALAVPAVAWFEWLLLGSRLTLWQWAFSSVVVAGAGLYAHADLVGMSYSRPLLLGYAWAGANLLAYVTNSVLDRTIMSTKGQSAAGMAMLTQAISLPICLAHGALLHDLTPASAVGLLAALDASHTAALLLTGACAALLGRCYAQCYKMASATAVTIAGNVNKAVSVLASVVFFGASISRVQLFGLTLCLGGAMAYSLTATKQRAEPAVAQPAAKGRRTAAATARAAKGPAASATVSRRTARSPARSPARRSKAS